MVSSNWPPSRGGGAEAYVADLTAALRERGHRVAGVTLGIDGEDVVGIVPACPHRLDAHRGSGRLRQAMFHGADVWRRSSIATLRAAAQRFAPDVVHTHVVTGMSVSALTAPSRMGVPHVHTLHDHWLRCWRSTGTRANQQPCGPACTAVSWLRAAALRQHGPHVVVGISEAVLNSHAELGGEATVVRHPAAAAPSAVRTPSAPTTFGFLGQLNPNKGVQVFLDAARILAGAGLRFVVAGRGRLQGDVEAASTAGVQYRGWVAGQDKEAFFADIDCLVVPSVWAEPAGLVVNEAAARGIPVIASAVGGLPEYVPASCRPLLTPPSDAHALAAAMRRFADAPERFVVDPAHVLDWDEHLAALLRAYERARELVQVAA